VERKAKKVRFTKHTKSLAGWVVVWK
jgi:hypothetical protein